MWIQQKYRTRVIVIAVIYLTIKATVCWGSTVNINNGLLHEKFTEKVQQVDMLASYIDEMVVVDKDWGIYDYVRTLHGAIDYLDEQHMTFAAQYVYLGEKLTEASSRTPSYTDSPFDPTVYPEFTTAVSSQDSGQMVLPFTPKGEPERDMYTYFRWIPTEDTLTGRILVVVAISQYTVQTNAALLGSLPFLFDFIVSFALVVILTYFNEILGCVWAKRRGKQKPAV